MSATEYSATSHGFGDPSASTGFQNHPSIAVAGNSPSQRSSPEQRILEMRLRIDARVQERMRNGDERCAHQARIQELQAQIVPLEVTLVTIEADPDAYSVTEYLEAQLVFDGARFELREAQHDLMEADAAKFLQNLREMENARRARPVEYAVRKKRDEERRTMELGMEADRDFWKAEAQRQKARADALDWGVGQRSSSS